MFSIVLFNIENEILRSPSISKPLHFGRISPSVKLLILKKLSKGGYH